MINAVNAAIIDFESATDNNSDMKYLSMHKNKVSQNKDGKYRTLVISKEGGRKQIVRNSKEDIEKAIIEYYKSQENNPTVRDCFNMWNDEKFRYSEIAKQTYDKYRAEFKRFFKGIAELKIKYITEIELKNFIKETIRDLKLTRKAFSDMKTLLNGIFKYAKEYGYTLISISAFMNDLVLPKRLFTKKIVIPEEKVFTENEMKLLTEYLLKHGDIHSLGLLLAAHTGLRAGELTALKYSDLMLNNEPPYISVERTEITVKNEKGKYTKEIQDNTKTEAGTRKVFIHPKTVELLKVIRRKNPFSEFILQIQKRNSRGAGLKPRSYFFL